jgi:YVTN family beta-propeller protein
MHSNNSSGTRAASARRFMAIVAILLAMGLGVMARPAEAAPFAYALNPFSNSNTVSVIDTATNPPSVVATVTLPVGSLSFGVAVTPDGKHVYVTNINSANVFVIRTATNKVVATVPVGAFPLEVAVAPDGKHAYVTNGFIPGTVNVIDTASNTVVGTPITVGSQPIGIAVTPDGKYVYVVNDSSNNVSVIRTATSTVVATVPVGLCPFFVAFTPDGTHAYVPNEGDGTVSVIATATKTVVATVQQGFNSNPTGVAVTPDGKHAYVTGENNVSVIDTASNTVVATVPAAGFSGVAIVPPPPGVPFLAFSATALDIAFGAAANQDSFNLHSQFTLSSTAPGLHPHRDPVTLSVGTFSITYPPGSFREQPDGSFFFAGVINGVSLKAQIYPTGTWQYAFHAMASGESLTFTTSPVYVTLSISGDSGATSVTATISGTGSVTAGISR